jgi:hypothetical protein
LLLLKAPPLVSEAEADEHHCLLKEIAYFYDMRFRAIFFALLVGWAIIAPASVIAFKTQHSCCQNKKAGKTPVKKHGDCCKNGLCNPFKACCNCAFDIQSRLEIAAPVLQPVSTSILSFYTGLQPSYIGSCFHPPECPLA